MRHANKGWRAIPQHDFLDDGFKIDIVLAKTLDIPLLPFRKRALRQALPAPIERNDGEAATSQFTHGLEILLYELGAPLKQADGALRSSLAVPSRKAQRDPVVGLQGAGDRALRNRIVGDRNQPHGRYFTFAIQEVYVTPKTPSSREAFISYSAPDTPGSSDLCHFRKSTA